MDLHYSNKELDQIEIQINRSIKVLEDNGTIIGEMHNLSVIRKLIEENRILRAELIRKYLDNESKIL